MRRNQALFSADRRGALAAALIMGGILAASPSPVRGQILAGSEAGDHFGQALAWAGDVNGDGRDDFLVGIPGGDGAGSNAGEVHLYLGQIGRYPDQPALVLRGETGGDAFGQAVCSAGDIDRDGYDDFLVGAPGRNSNGLDAGRVYLFLGDNTPDAVADKTWDGDLPGGRFGAALAGGFNFNGDSRPDFAVGAPSHAGVGLRAGQVRLFLGSASGYATEGYAFTGDFPNWELGFSLDCAGDFNRDGFDDLIAGAPQNFDQNSGRAVIWLGKGSTLGAPTRLTLVGEAGSDRFGTDVSGAGDLNGDGTDDVIVGAPRHDSAGLDKGAVYIFRGGPSPDVNQDWKATGSSSGDRLGSSLDGGFDMNADGRPDFAVGAPGADSPASAAGEVRIYFGQATPRTGADRVLAPAPPVTSFEANDEFGTSVRFVGNYNDDSFAELVVGAPMGNSAAGGEAGYVNLVTHPGSFTPVRLVSFGVEVGEAGLWLKWRLADGDELAGLRLERVEGTAATPLHSGWLAPGTREFLIPTPFWRGEQAQIRLLAQNRNGQVVPLGSLPVFLERPALVLGAPNQNPSRGEVALPLSHDGGPVRATVWNVQGRAVRALLDELRPAGSFMLHWNGRDDAGRRVPAGVYFLRVEAGGRSVRQRLLRLP